MWTVNTCKTVFMEVSISVPVPVASAGNDTANVASWAEAYVGQVLTKAGITLGAVISTNVFKSWGTLCDYKTGKVLRPATQAEWEASKASEKSNIGGGSGTIEVDGQTVYVDDRQLDPPPAYPKGRWSS